MKNGNYVFLYISKTEEINDESPIFPFIHDIFEIAVHFMEFNFKRDK